MPVHCTPDADVTTSTNKTTPTITNTAAAPSCHSMPCHHRWYWYMGGNLVPCVVPGAPNANGDVELHVELVGAAHLRAHDLLDLLLLARGDLEDELVVHLEQQPGTQPLVT